MDQVSDDFRFRDISVLYYDYNEFCHAIQVLGRSIHRSEAMVLCIDGRGHTTKKA